MKKNEPLKLGRVIANYGARSLVQDQDGSLHRCASLRKLGLLVSGDQVKWQKQQTGDARIEEIIERTSLLQRVDRRSQLKPVAANLTRLMITSAVKPGIDTILIDSYIAAAELANIQPCIVINKIDLVSETKRPEVDALIERYNRIGYETVIVHCNSEEGIQPLRKSLRGQVSTFVGQSGVGKSSIVNRLLPDLDLRVGALSEASGQGSHTTTVSSWYDLDDNGGALIDSPGVRQFSLEHVSKTELAKGFLDISSTAQDCRFSNCIHVNEPDCAVKESMENNGFISRERYRNYLKLIDLTEQAQS